MALAIVLSRALAAATSAEVVVEVHLANGLPCFTIVGLPDAEVRESRERVRAAIQYSGLEFPTRRITVNLAPADLPKASGRFDLPIALGILLASEQLPPKSLDHAVFAGELSLNGALRPIRGALAVACGVVREAARSPASAPALYLPKANAADAARAPGVRVYGVTDLLSLCRHLRGEVQEHIAAAVPLANDTSDAFPLDMADVIGQSAAKRGMEVAAAGGHHVLMIGPPGAGKTMLASRMPGILPPMAENEALAAAVIAGSFGHGTADGPSGPGQMPPQATAAPLSGVWGVRPFRAPHHSASAAALVGGGNPPRPGEMTLSHHGVLFLDELPEFERRTLEMLREPLESGAVTVSRAGCQTRFPAECQLIAAMNPCPCGWGDDPNGRCRCTVEAAARYRNKLSGPLLDRIDIQLHLTALKPAEFMGATPRAHAPQPSPRPRNARPSSAVARETSAAIRHRVTLARERQLTRQGGANARMGPDALARHCALDRAGSLLMQSAMQRFGWTARTHYRVLKVARSIADLEGSATLKAAHLSEAIQFRQTSS